MAMLCDKYQPQSFHDIKHNHNAYKMIMSITSHDDMPHLIIQGANGCGKKTFVELLLKHKYGDFNTKLSTISFKSITTPLYLLSSIYHHQINFSIHNTYDRKLLKLYLEEISTQPISKVKYRIIVLENADMLSIDAQESLRKTLETYIKNMRFIFISSKKNKIIDALRSRCTVISLDSPTYLEIQDILTEINFRETGMKQNTDTINLISNNCERNIKLAINYLEMYLLKPDEFSIENMNPVLNYCEQIIDIIVKGSDISKITDHVREKIYVLINYCVDPKLILQYLLQSAINKIPRKYYHEKYLLALKASERDLSLKNSSKSIYHLEGYCIFIMEIIKKVMVMQKKAAC
jgi:DNA polymerase III delta prime subunit